MYTNLGLAAFEYKQPIGQVFQQISNLGMKQCELVTPEDVRMGNVHEVLELMKEFKISVTAVTSLTKLNSTDDIKKTQEIINESILCAAQLGAPFVVTYFGGHHTRTPEEAIKLYKESIKPCLKLAEENNITILIENHFSHAPGEVTNTAQGCLELLQLIDSKYFQLNFDPCNFVIGGEEFYPYAYEKLKPYIKNVHMKDTVKYDFTIHSDYKGRIVNDLNQGDFIFVKLGSGILNGDQFLKQLLQDGYKGPITIEAHTPGSTLNDVFRIGIQYCMERLD